MFKRIAIIAAIASAAALTACSDTQVASSNLSKAHAKLEASATYQEVKAAVFELHSQLRKHKEHWAKTEIPCINCCS